MLVEVKMPSLGVAISYGTLVRWLKKEGDFVNKGEIIAEVETEKVNFEITSPETGVLEKILYDEQAVVPVDDVVAIIRAEAEAQAILSREISVSSGDTQVETTASLATNKTTTYRANPAAKLLARELGIDLQQVQGTGPRGRITKQDVIRFHEQTSSQPATATPSPELVVSPARTSGIETDVSAKEEEFIPFTDIRKRIADHMIQSLNTAAHVTTVIEADMSEVVHLRNALRDFTRETHGFNLTYLPFVIKAASLAISHFPIVNSTLEGDRIIVKKYQNFGIAMALPTGLVAPVLRRVERKDLMTLGREVEEMIHKAREGKITPDDMVGGTFTISNAGAYGSVLSTPIIHQPQSAILWMGRVAKTTVVSKDDKIEIRSMMYLCASYDHRIFDGAVTAQFLSKIKEYLANPYPLLLQ